jgi:UDP-glucose 4-epimerase
MEILVTGGSGYIGSHTVIELINFGYKVVVVDNLCNSKIESLKRVEKLTNSKIPFYKLDVRDKKALKKIFEKHDIYAVIHFAGLKSVSDSIINPTYYYDVNVGGAICIMQLVQEFACKSFIFSSSATVYGNPSKVPIKETFPLCAVNPYGRSKLMVENILQDMLLANTDCKIALLRYFNPVGAHVSGLIGENPKNTPNNLMPYISQVAIGKLDKLKIFGADYNTSDGTGVRDYIHVIDLARGHIKALEYLENNQLLIANLGTGKGYSVLDLIKTFEATTKKKIPYEIVARRKGDVATCYTDTSYAFKKLNWQAKYKLDKMCKDTWRWQKNNPNGY